VPRWLALNTHRIQGLIGSGRPHSTEELAGHARHPCVARLLPGFGFPAMCPQMFSGVDSKCVVLFHFKVAYGGGRSTGFGLIYDNVEALKTYEPRWRQIRYGFADPRTRKRKAYKELKKKIRKTWGTGRRTRIHKERRAAEE